MNLRGLDAWIEREPRECAERPKPDTCPTCCGAAYLYLEGPHTAGCYGHCDVCVELECTTCEGRGTVCPECGRPGDGSECGCLGAEYDGLDRWEED